MSLLKTLLTNLASGVPDAIYGKSTNFSMFPITTYNVINSITTRMPAFTSRSETFDVQFSYFDDNEDCEDLIDEQEDTESTLRTLVSASAYNFEEIKKVGTIGPRYLRDQKYWQIIDLYSITVCEDKHPIVTTTTPEPTTTTPAPIPLLTIILDLDGGTGVDPFMQVYADQTYGEAIGYQGGGAVQYTGLPTNIMVSKPGFVFLGWYSSDLNIDVEDSMDVYPYDHTLLAVWGD